MRSAPSDTSKPGRTEKLPRTAKKAVARAPAAAQARWRETNCKEKPEPRGRCLGEDAQNLGGCCSDFYSDDSALCHKHLQSNFRRCLSQPVTPRPRSPATASHSRLKVPCSASTRPAKSVQTSELRPLLRSSLDQAGPLLALPHTASCRQVRVVGLVLCGGWRL